MCNGEQAEADASFKIARDPRRIARKSLTQQYFDLTLGSPQKFY
jgi:hypothetical protein